MLGTLVDALQRQRGETNHVIRIGLVVGLEPARHRVRVQMQDQDGLVTHTVPVLCRKATADKDAWLPDVGDQGVILSLPYGQEQGVYLGSIFSGPDPVPALAAAGGADVQERAFKDGSRTGYDRRSHRLFRHVQGAAEGGGIDEQLQGDLFTVRVVDGNLLVKLKEEQQLPTEPPDPPPADDWRELKGKGYVVFEAPRMIVLNAPQVLIMGSMTQAAFRKDLLEEGIWSEKIDAGGGGQ